MSTFCKVFDLADALGTVLSFIAYEECDVFVMLVSKSLTTRISLQLRETLGWVIPPLLPMSWWLRFVPSPRMCEWFLEAWKRVDLNSNDVKQLIAFAIDHKEATKIKWLLQYADTHPESKPKGTWRMYIRFMEMCAKKEDGASCRVIMEHVGGANIHNNGKIKPSEQFDATIFVKAMRKERVYFESQIPHLVQLFRETSLFEWACGMCFCDLAKQHQPAKGSPLGPNYVLPAIEYGHLDMVRWLVQTFSFSKHTMDLARVATCEFGHHILFMDKTIALEFNSSQTLSEPPRVVTSGHVARQMRAQKNPRAHAFIIDYNGVSELKFEFVCPERLVHTAFRNGHKETITWLMAHFSMETVSFDFFSEDLVPQAKEMYMEMFEENWDVFVEQKVDQTLLAMWAIQNGLLRTIQFIFEQTRATMGGGAWGAILKKAQYIDPTTLSYYIRLTKTVDVDLTLFSLECLCKRLLEANATTCGEEYVSQREILVAMIIKVFQLENQSERLYATFLCFFTRCEPCDIDLCYAILQPQPNLLSWCMTHAPVRWFFLAQICTAFMGSSKFRVLMSLVITGLQAGLQLSSWSTEEKLSFLDVICASEYPEEAFWFTCVVNESTNLQIMKQDVWSTEDTRWHVDASIWRRIIDTIIVPHIAYDTEKTETCDGFLRTDSRLRFLHRLANEYHIFTDQSQLQDALFHNTTEGYLDDFQDSLKKKLQDLHQLIITKFAILTSLVEEPLVVHHETETERDIEAETEAETEGETEAETEAETEGETEGDTEGEREA